MNVVVMGMKGAVCSRVYWHVICEALAVRSSPLRSRGGGSGRFHVAERGSTSGRSPLMIGLLVGRHHDACCSFFSIEMHVMSSGMDKSHICHSGLVRDRGCRSMSIVAAVLHGAWSAVSRLLKATAA